MQLKMSFCYEVPVYRCQLVRETSLSLAERPVVASPAVAAKLLTDYLQGADREHFVVILLDSKNRVIGITTVSVGILDSSLVHPREVYKTTCTKW
ncbi:MAG TPA: JAB domain-containing protein [Chthonomonadaceae bacterium]|nr:JAB domain-containing protein [Chthonomonadaceae bacterium]